MTDDYRYRDEDWLREQYVENDYTITEIADMCDCNSSTISNWLGRFDIDTGYEQNKVEYEQLKDPGWLQQQVDEDKTSTEIADEVGCVPGTVRRKFRKHGIKLPDDRGRFEVQYPELHDPEWLQEAIHEDGKLLTEIADELGCSVSHVSKQCHANDVDVPAYAGPGRPEKEHGWESSGNWVDAHDWLTHDQLYRAYWEYFWTQAEIANWCDVGRRFVNEKLQEHDIERRTAFETRRAQQMFRPDKKLPDTTKPAIEKERPHMYDDADMDAATVRRIIGYPDESTDDNGADTDSRLTWTDVAEAGD